MTEYNGVERSTTERLRQLLDKRGVEWETLSDQQEGEFTITATRWHDGEGGLLTMCINEPNGSTWDFFWLPTPEQAIVATLGRGTCKYDFVPNIGNGFLDSCGLKCSCCGREQMSMEAPKFCPECGRRVEK